MHVRNLLIISKAPGEGIVSASLVTDGRDQLTGVTGVPIKADGSEGAPFTATLSNTVSHRQRRSRRADRQRPDHRQQPDLAAGLTARLTLTFANAGEVTVRRAGGRRQRAAVREHQPAPSRPPSA